MCRDPLEMEMERDGERERGREEGREGGEREKDRQRVFTRIAKVVQVPIELVYMHSHTVFQKQYAC